MKGVEAFDHAYEDDLTDRTVGVSSLWNLFLSFLRVLIRNVRD